MLLERNGNKRLTDIAVIKHNVLPQNQKKILKENKVPISNTYMNYNSFKQPIEQVFEEPEKSLLDTETNKIKSTNLKKIVAFELSKSKGNYRSDFLIRHRISADVRTRMVK